MIVSVSGDHPRGATLFAESIAAYEEVGDLGGSRGRGRIRAMPGRCKAMWPAARKRSAVAWNWPSVRAAAGTKRSRSTCGGSEPPSTGTSTGPQQLLGSSIAIFDEVGDGRGVAYGRTVLAECLVQQGAAAEAVAALREAIRGFALVPERWGLVYACSLLVSAEAARGDWQRTALVLGLVQGLCERTGGELFPYQRQRMALVAAECEAQLGSERFARHQTQEIRRSQRRHRRGPVAARPRPAKLASAVGAGSHPRLLALTPRELEVAQLIAEGLTNRQIGQRLFIAERTVDTHVGRILTKLSCATRSQVAAMVAGSAINEGRPGNL